MPRKFVISPTKLRTYYQCPAEYRLEYIERLGRFYHRARAGLSFGNSLHRVLDSFHVAGGADAVSLAEMEASLASAWVVKGYSSEAEAEAYHAEALRILADYRTSQEQAAADAAASAEAPAAPRLLWTEKTIRIDLSPDVALSGRIDRVDEHEDGTLEIIDYKSGRETVTDEDVAGSLALSIYQLLIKRQLPDRRVVATMVALRTGSKATAELDPSTLEQLEAKCLETGEIIQNKDWENVLPVVNVHCPNCDFLPHCSQFWKQEARRNGVEAPSIVRAAS